MEEAAVKAMMDASLANMRAEMAKMMEELKSKPPTSPKPTKVTSPKKKAKKSGKPKEREVTTDVEAADDLQLIGMLGGGASADDSEDWVYI